MLFIIRLPNTKVILCRFGLERWGLGLVIIDTKIVIKGIKGKDGQEEEENIEVDDYCKVEEEIKKGFYKIIV